MDNDQTIQTLIDLGLSFLQAKTYLALFILGTASIKKVSKSSNMARQDTYRIMPTLEKMGLAEKLITTPTTYKAAPIKDTFAILIEKRTEKLDEVKKKTEELLNKWPKNNAETAQLDEEEYFAVTCERTGMMRRFKSTLMNTRMTVDNMAPWKNFVEGNYLYNELVKKGLKVRALTEEPSDAKLIPRNSKVLNKNPLFEYRFISTPPLIGIFLFDKKQVALFTTLPIEPSWTVLWSNCQALVKIVANYFEENWKAAYGPESDSKLKSTRTLN